MNRTTATDFICSIRNASQPAISPDGSRVVYLVTENDRETLESNSNLWITGIDGSDSRQLTFSGGSHVSPTWTPDGEAIVYAGPPDEKPGFAIYKLSLLGGEAQEIGRADELPGDFEFSPDGKSLAFIAQYDPSEKSDRKSGLAPVRVVTRVDYKEDGYGIPNETQYQVFVLDLASAEVRRLTEGRFDHSTLAWSPYGETLGVIKRMRVGLRSQLVLIDIESGDQTLIGPTNDTIRSWSWSPDGSSIVCFRSPHAEFDGGFYLYDVNSGTERPLTGALQWAIGYTWQTLTWLDDTHIVASGYESARSGLWKLDVTTGELERILLEDSYRSGISSSAGHAIIVQGRDSATESGELIAFDPATNLTTPLTHLNADYLTVNRPGTIEQLQTENEGLTIGYMLKKPHDFDANRSYPVIFEIHGGPHMFRGYHIETSNQLLLDAGYLVVCPNPRGSTSYGLDFTRGVLGDWGGGDWRDIVAVVDAVAAMPFVDEPRLGIYGYSYGGYMSSWAIGQTDRFRAAVIGAPLTDLISRDGTSDIGYAAAWLEYNGSLPDIHEMLVRQSPVTHMHKAVTPTLILHPEDDQRCPIGQGEQLFIGLKRAGVETEFVRYPGESHLMPWTGPVEYRIDFYTRILDWFEKYL